MDYSDEVLEKTPERATKFLTGLGALPTVRTLLAQYGLNDAEIKEGRAFLLKCLAEPKDPTPEADTDDAKAQRAAVAELDEWDEPNFKRIGATLQRHFSSAAEYVFRDLAPSTGADAVAGVATFLLRLNALEQGTDESRAGTRKVDKKAVELLAKRGLDKAERQRLQALVDVALGPTETLPEASDEPNGGGRRAALVDLRMWYDEWAETAKAVVKKKSHRIRLGLANRKAPAKSKKAASGRKKPAEEPRKAADAPN